MVLVCQCLALFLKGFKPHFLENLMRWKHLKHLDPSNLRTSCKAVLSYSRRMYEECQIRLDGEISLKGTTNLNIKTEDQSNSIEKHPNSKTSITIPNKFVEFSQKGEHTRSQTPLSLLTFTDSCRSCSKKY